MINKSGLQLKSVILFLLLTFLCTENQCWYLAESHARSVTIFWRLWKAYCNPRTRSTVHSIVKIKRRMSCCYFSCCGIHKTCTNRNFSWKIHLKSLVRRSSEVGSSFFWYQGPSMIQTNDDLIGCWTSVDAPQTVSLQIDVTAGLKINSVNLTSIKAPSVTPTKGWTPGSAAPTITIY